MADAEGECREVPHDERGVYHNGGIMSVVSTLPFKALSLSERPAEEWAVRSATSEDIPVLLAMGTEFLATTAYAAHVVPNLEAMRRTAEMLIAAGGLFVGEQGGRVVGMIGLVLYPHPWSGETVASEMFWWADPAMRGRLGLRMLTHAEAWAKSNGASQIQMIAPTARVGTLYERRGYVAVETAWQKGL